MRIKTSQEVGEFIEDIYSKVAALNPAIIGRAGLYRDWEKIGRAHV